MEPKAQGPLAGYRVLELGTTIAGPFCGRLLADFGADVIKVEPPDGDPVRAMGKHVGEVSLWAASILRGKKLVALDLKSAEGQEIVREITKGADVVVENFRPGALEKWGLGYADLAAVRPGIIMVRISGFGQDGPYSSRPGYGVIGEAVGGLRHIIGDPDRPPARVAVPLTDYITGLYAALGAVMAIVHREKTGEGQFIDAALFEAAFSFMEPFVPAFEKLGFVPTRAGPNLPGQVPNSLYPTADDGYVHIAATTQALFKRLIGVMGREDLIADARFATPLARGRNPEALDPVIAEWTSRHTAAALEKILIEEADVPASRVYTMADVFDDAHYRARGMLTEVADADLGSVRLAAPVPRMSETPGAIRWAGGRVGADTREILREIGGLTDERIDALAAAGVVRLADDGPD
ncbi:MAG: CoA transferase [Rhodospirillales bacterium]|jgi:crotonobetainyl-CoA:carnitine CoA-transferase CaiB-like acyl-CoA transferase|nr:CoA transferase [Rhodospirillales bacterium]MDP6804000.1 CoA transferase [Rhodospirillales bacterium]